MKVRFFDINKDYEDIKSWCEQRQFPILVKEMLSTTGFICEDESNKIAATWVYITNSPTFLMQFTINNPNLDWKIRNEGMQQIFNAASDFSKKHGAKLLLASVENKRLIEKLEVNGFEQTDKNVTHMIRGL